jgi:hypothetical protein
MRHVRLIATADEYDKSPGLIVKGTPMDDGMMADRDGLLIAHDLIEHQNGSKHIGRVWDELEALGGIWHARGRWGDLMQKHETMYSPAQNVASDLTRMFGEDWQNEFPPRKHRLKATRPCDHDEDFLEIIEISRHDIPREHEETDRDEMERYLGEALHRMRTGFRKANKRFGTRFASNSQMRAIKDAVESVARYIEFEGQEFVLSYGNGDATCREFYYEEDY